MKLIKPSNISGEIMTLMEEADQKVILISPYCRFKYWKKLLNKFKILKSRNIDIEFYVREGEGETIREVEAINIKPITVPRLHAKLYLNEKEAIVSSMNLSKSSDDSSLDIGYKTENEREYLELVDFYKRYILKHKKQNSSSIGNWEEKIYEALCQAIDPTLSMNIEENIIQINTGLNNYEVFIANDRQCFLRLNGILSQHEFQQAQYNKGELENNIGCRIELIEGRYGHYDMIWATGLENMESDSFDFLNSDEIEKVINVIIRFCVEVDNFKMSCR
ncbi:MAG: hypothetical protein P1U70_20955 [Saprospiraceae bacterium]|nr:hypothetical protein [Saprospiraceae bacterium]